MARRKKTEKRELSHEDIPRNTRATARRLLGRMARQWWKLLLATRPKQKPHQQPLLLPLPKYLKPLCLRRKAPVSLALPMQITM